MEDGGKENDDAEKEHDDADSIVESHGKMDAGSRENFKGDRPNIGLPAEDRAESEEKDETGRDERRETSLNTAKNGDGCEEGDQNENDTHETKTVR